jgi:hypothetical protein
MPLWVIEEAFMRVAFRVFAAGVITAGLSTFASAQSLDDVIGKYLNAHGADKWRQVESMKVEATVDAQGRSALMTSISKRPNLVRQEVTINGNTVIEAFDGTTVWGINPQLSPEAQRIQGPQATALADQSDFDLVLLDYKKKGFEAELVGKAKVGDRDAWDVKVTQKNGVVQDYFIDATTFLEDRVATEITRRGQTLNSTSEPSDFRNVEGVMMPFTITQQVVGMPAAVLHVRRIEFNVPAPDELFKMPPR